ncbi:pilus assembly protein PilC [Acinetobacter beijerinckii]|uniref:pilus assembly protein PilC n=1 Tax=Acinetobacter beijerinckii TaxID=262668 RepID=UPI002404E7AC|nr:pilus assembly protein PilC [Acinetobacter beijerinckii]
MKKIDQKNILSATGSMFMTLAICHSASVYASDIDIYSNATGGKTTITMMLDTSGSMGNGLLYYSTTSKGQFNGDKITDSLQEDYNVCVDENSTRYKSNSNIRTENKSLILSDNSSVNYTRYYCRVTSSSSQFNRLKSEKVCQDLTTELRCFDRLTRLKDALINVFSDTGIGSNVIIGLGQYSSSTTDNESNSNADSSSGRILVPAKIMNDAQRDNLIKAVVKLSPYGGTPTAHAYAEAGAYMLGQTTKASSNNGGSGFDKSTGTDIKKTNGTSYNSPFGTSLPTISDTCNGQGIYFLTDGAPNSSDNSARLMSRALGQSSGTFSDAGGLPNGSQSNNQMSYVGAFSKKLKNDYNIKTAVVGFGKDFRINNNTVKLLEDPQTKKIRPYYDCSLLTGDPQNACNWGAKTHPDLPSSVGGFGSGGFYSAQSTQDIIDSIKYFVDDIKPEFDPVATGSPTLPQDTLNPLRIQPYGYYASFIPKPQESTQLWVGNLNKYHIYNGELYNSAKTIRLIRSDGSLDSSASGLWTGGMKAKLPLGLMTNTANEKVVNRTLYTNRQISGSSPYVASEANTLKKVNITSLFGTGSDAFFVNDLDKNYWLNLLGYNVGATETGVTLENLALKPELRQVGAIMHSTPILLTQKGKITVNSNGELDTTNRDDYLLFGSTQGLLHVVDASTGVEKFAFAPNEMMQNQKNAFLSEASSTLGKNNLFYGIDAPWTAYSQYVSKADGTLTVDSSDRTSNGGANTNLALKGLQWVYGGLRMGGRSYYALNLSDLDKPSLKFHINPKAADNSDGTINTSNALSYMGQSWSKPTLAYVKFGGVKKLVMFVGGGYDAGYESAAYNQTSNVGAGVYMFDADDGSLLWWASANATAAKGAEAYTDASANTINMKYSVVSQINAIDRDNDGLVDNLYFGDLGGQAFRVDLNNNATGANASDKKANFATRAVRLFTENTATGASPRFYEMPSFSIHDGDNGYIAAVAFSSGNRSSPLVGAVVANGNQAGSTISAADSVFVVYDKDVAKSDLYSASPAPTLVTQNISLSSLNSNISTGVAVASNDGWKYTYSTNAGAYKGMNELYALDNMLYVNVYHRDGVGIGGSCGAGVKGDSYIYQFCLPTGKCSFSTTIANTPNSVKLGAGILGSGLGQDLGGSISQLVVTRPNNLNCTTTPNKPECQKFSTTAKLRQLRWYETR